jgi:hypothetical protein
MQNDPLYKYRYTLAGLLLALALNVVIAALIGAAVGELLFGDSYGARAWTYIALLLYVIAGTVALFFSLKDAPPEQGLDIGRLALWAVSLWFWPLLIFRRRG